MRIQSAQRKIPYGPPLLVLVQLLLLRQVVLLLLLVKMALLPRVILYMLFRFTNHFPTHSPHPHLCTLI